jgi:hypothetical protein
VINGPLDNRLAHRFIHDLDKEELQGSVDRLPAPSHEEPIEQGLALVGRSPSTRQSFAGLTSLVNTHLEMIANVAQP